MLELTDKRSRTNSSIGKGHFGSIEVKEQTAMTKLRLIGTAMLALVLVGPAMATHQRYHYRDGRELPVQDAVHFGRGSGWCGYHSGYGGLYGDGLYPENVCDDGGSHLID
jgi:hypothetical protein